MSGDGGATRRSFLKGGAALAAPLAAAAAPAAVLAEHGSKARVRRLEDEAALRELHRSWLRQVNAGEGHALLDDTVRGIAAHPAGAPDRIAIAADGRTAVGHFDCTVESETPLAQDCTLAQMAHVQGYGAIRRTERRLLTVQYARSGAGWKIAKVALTAI